MRIAPALVGLSVATNLCLGYALLSRPKGAVHAEAVAGASAQGAGAVGATAGVGAGTAVAGGAAAAGGDTVSSELVRELPVLFQRLVEGDFVAEIARLRAAGLSEDLVAQIGQVAMFTKFQKAFEEPGASQLVWGGQVMTDAQRAEQRKFWDLQRKMSDDARAAGIDLNWFGETGGKVPGLSDEKAKQVARIQNDHQELRSRIHMEAGGLMLERDTERLKLLDRELKKDLAALLTPEELEAWTLHSSQTAQTLRAELAYMAPTEAEFRDILKLQAAFDEAWPSDYGPGTDWQTRGEAEQAMKEQIEALLGPERAADYRKATDYEFALLSNLEYRLELPKGTADRVYGLRKETEAAAAKIRGDETLGEGEREESLKVLVEQVKAEMNGALGEEGFKAYGAQHGHWLEYLAR